MLLRAPKVRKGVSPGQRPRYRDAYETIALKVRYNVLSLRVVAPFQGSSGNVNVTQGVALG